MCVPDGAAVMHTWEVARGRPAYERGNLRMRFIRSAATTLTLAGAATLAAAAVPAFTAPAFAQGPVVSVTPSTATPGESVTFTITCDHRQPRGMRDAVRHHARAATADTDEPDASPGEFAVTVNLPTSISPGVLHAVHRLQRRDGADRVASPVRARPTDHLRGHRREPVDRGPGSQRHLRDLLRHEATSATLFGITLGLAEQIPMEASTHAGEFVTTVTLPTSIIPGSYSPSSRLQRRDVWHRVAHGQPGARSAAHRRRR